MNETPCLPEHTKIETFELSSGMRVAICRQPSFHRVCILLNVASGCRDERVPGTAHMLEHLIFRGSRQHPSLRDLSEAFEACGADFNAYTAREVTSFDVSLPAESLDVVLNLIGDVMSHPKLSGIAAERDIIREEILSDYDGDGSLISVDDLLVSLFYGEAGHVIAGSPNDLAKISKNEVVAFYEAHYAASNMLLVLTGAVEEDPGLSERLERAFKDIRTDYQPWHRRAIPDCYAEFLRTGRQVQPRLCIKKYDGATQSEALMGFLTGPATSMDFPALEMLVRALDDGLASRLSRRLIEELALVYDAEAFLSTTQESTLMQIRVTCRHRRVTKVIEAVYGILHDIARDGISETEIERLKKRVIWEHQGMVDGVAQFAQWISTMKLQGMPCDVFERCESLLSVFPEEIQRMADRLMHEFPHIVAVVGDLGGRSGEEIQNVMKGALDRDVLLTML